MGYGISSRDYLHRAKKRLLDDTLESLFYAAFELRCSIERRMQQYLEAQEFISKKVKKSWRIAELGKNIDRIFTTGDKIAEFTIIEKETGNTLYTFYYTPVTLKLKKMAEKLGDLMHAMKKYRTTDDQWWHDTRKYLEEVCQELEKANVGTLLGVPLIKKGTKELYMNIEILKGRSPDKIKDVFQTGTQHLLKVRYLNELLPDAIKRE